MTYPIFVRSLLGVSKTSRSPVRSQAKERKIQCKLLSGKINYDFIKLGSFLIVFLDLETSPLEMLAFSASGQHEEFVFI
jgi:hypothetical protein